MLSLLYMELRRVRPQLLMGAAMLAAFSLFSAAVTQGPPFALILFAVLPIVMGMTLPINNFVQEERSNALAFMRALPVRPWEIVVAKYGASYAVVLILCLALLAAAPLFPELPMTRILQQVSLITILSLPLFAMSYFLLFLLGLKRGRMAGMIVFFGALFLSSLLRQYGSEGVLPGAANLDGLLALGATPSGPVLAVVAGTGAVCLSCAASARIFGGRDLSRMP